MSKIFVFYLLFTCLPICSFSQDTNKKQDYDSIQYYLKKEKGSYSLSTFRKVIQLAEKVQIDSLIKKANIKYGIESYYKKDTAGLNIAKNNLVAFYSRTKDSFALGKYYHFKALIHRLLYQTDSSFFYYHQSKNIFAQLKDSLEVGKRLTSMAIIQKIEKDYLGSEITTIEGLKYIEPLNEFHFSIDLNSNLGTVLMLTGRYKEAREYFYIAQELNKKNLSKKRREQVNLHLLNNIGLSYLKADQFNIGIPFFREGLKHTNLEVKYPKQYEILLENLSYCLFKLGHKKEALKGYQKALKSKEKHQNIFGQSTSHSLLSKFYMEEKAFKKAEFHAKKGYDLSKKVKDNSTTLTLLMDLTALSSGETAKKYLNAYNILNDSLIEKQSALKDGFAKIRYETAKKDKENAELKLENNLKELQIVQEKQEKTIGWLAAGGALLFLGFSANAFYIRRKKLLFEAQLQSVEAREQERQQIAKSLHDEVAGDLQMLHQKLTSAQQIEKAKDLELIKNTVRDLSHQLSSVSFDEVSFKDQFINLIMDISFDGFTLYTKGIDNIDWKSINNTIKRMLYLCSRESILNAKKHAAASIVNIAFKEVKKNIILTIKDNGKGFDVSGKRNGIGLKNQKERIEEINGTILIESEIGKGTHIHIQIPLYAK